MSEDPIVRFEWEFAPEERDDADSVLKALESEGADARLRRTDEKGIAFLPIIAGAMAVVGLAHVIKNLWDDMQPGVVIDARGKTVKIAKNKNLPRGVVVVVKKDGSVAVEQPDREKLADVLKAVAA